MNYLYFYFTDIVSKIGAVMNEVDLYVSGDRANGRK